MREEKIRRMRATHNYCYICQRRAGNWHANCSPGRFYGYHGSGKRVSGKSYRAYRSWKHTRNKQWERV